MGGWKHWQVFRAYVHPNDQLIVHRLEQALAKGPTGTEMKMLLVGDINSQLVQPCDWRKEDLATAITNYGLDDQTLQLILYQSYRVEGVWPWRMWRDRGAVKGRGGGEGV